ncbi:hypothetical protein [Pilibacter termitis]|uniref:hypothetical protein n=1 Tax=Pilibacter termitis TaxID=263852 RepID=UPI0011850A97|nr:hypothetical protein [Pilibacter termitis]
MRQRTTSFIYSKHQFRATLRAVAQLLPLVARQIKAKWCVLKSATVNTVVHLLATSVASDIVNSCPTSAPCS